MYSTWDPGESLTDVPMPGDPEVTFTVRAFNNSRNQLGANFGQEDGTRASTGCVYLKVTTRANRANPSSGQHGRNYSADIASLSYVGEVLLAACPVRRSPPHLHEQAKVDSFDSREGRRDNWQ